MTKENKITDAIKLEIIEFTVGSVDCLSKYKLCMTDKNGNTITADLSHDRSDIKNLIEALRNTVELGSDMKVSTSFVVEKE